jgi:transposase
VGGHVSQFIWLRQFEVGKNSATSTDCWTGWSFCKALSCPPIGPINALTILAEAGDLRRFGHHRQFLKFCGMDLATIQSGTFRGQTKLSKYENARLRRTLWMAGQVAILQRTNSFRDKFERYIAKDRHNKHLRRKAYTAIAAKMARTVHGIIKNGEPYRPFFEE